MYLSHHGVLGQKWGVRRYQNPDGTRIENNKKRRILGFKSIKATRDEIDNRPMTKDVKQRSVDDIKLIDEIQEWEDNERKHIFRGKQIIHRLRIAQYKYSRIFDDVDSQNSLPLLRNHETKEESVMKVNPSNGSHLASGNNCCLCTIAYDLRRRGYDVIANQNAPISLLYDIGPQDVSFAYNNAVENICKTPSDLQRALNNQPNGSRGAAFCTWKGRNGGHVVAYEVKNGHAKLFDAQSGDVYSNVKDLFNDVSKVSYIRLDDKKPNYNLVRIAIE